MTERKKHQRLPNGMGSIRYLGSGRSKPYAAHPPAIMDPSTGHYQQPTAICYAETWESAYQALANYRLNEKLKHEPVEERRFGYVYRFLDDTGRILYVGKTRRLQARMVEHKRGKTLKPEQYAMVSKVQVMALPTYNDAGLAERYFIFKYRPPFNVAMSDEGPITLELIFPKGSEWVDYDWEYVGRTRRRRITN